VDCSHSQKLRTKSLRASKIELLAEVSKSSAQRDKKVENKAFWNKKQTKGLGGKATSKENKTWGTWE